MAPAGVAGTGVLAAGLAGLTLLAFGATPSSDTPMATVGAKPEPTGGTSLVPVGENLFQAKGCNACHALAGLPGRMPVGPDLTALGARAATSRPGLSAEEYVRESITDPRAFFALGPSGTQMPVIPLSELELDALVAFLLEPPR